MSASFKKIWRGLALLFLPYTLYLLVRLLFFTCKKKYNIEGDMPKEPVIFVFWHGKLLMQPCFHFKIRKKKYRDVHVLSSNHFDGLIMTKFDQYFGFKTVNIDKRKPINGFLNAIKKIKGGSDFAMTPDGPKGPIHSVSDGTVMLAQKTDAYMVASNYFVDKCWIISSWDKFVIPKPFSTITLFVSKPFKVLNMSTDDAKALIIKKLNEYEK